MKGFLEWLARVSVPVGVPSPGFAPCSSGFAFTEHRVRIRFQSLWWCHLLGQEESCDLMGVTSLVTL